MGAHLARIVLSSLLLGGALAQTPAPVLSDLQKLQVETLLKDIQIAQLEAAIAQAKFTVAREALAKVLATLQKDGYDFDLQTLTYVAKPASAPARSTP